MIPDYNSTLLISPSFPLEAAPRLYGISDIRPHRTDTVERDDSIIIRMRRRKTTSQSDHSFRNIHWDIVNNSHIKPAHTFLHPIVTLPTMHRRIKLTFYPPPPRKRSQILSKEPPTSQPTIHPQLDSPVVVEISI